MKKINWPKLIILILVTELIGLLANFFAGDIKTIYMSINKPMIAPPSFIFGIIWPILYLLIAIAVYMVYESYKTLEQKNAIKMYWLQLFVNFIWPIVFFRFLMFKEAFLIIVILDVLVVITTKLFYKINKNTIYFMIPYVLWLFFATYLNLWIALFN